MSWQEWDDAITSGLHLLALVTFVLVLYVVVGGLVGIGVMP